MGEGKRKYYFAIYVITLTFLALFVGKLTSGDTAIIAGIAAGLFPAANSVEHIAKAMRKSE